MYCSKSTYMTLSPQGISPSSNTRPVRKISDLRAGEEEKKKDRHTWNAGNLITHKVVSLGLHTLLPAVPPLLETFRESLFRNGV